MAEELLYMTGVTVRTSPNDVAGSTEGISPNQTSCRSRHDRLSFLVGWLETPDQGDRKFSPTFPTVLVWLSYGLSSGIPQLLYP